MAVSARKCYLCPRNGPTNTATTRKYTHLRPMHLVEPLEQLSRQIQIADVVMRLVKHDGPKEARPMDKKHVSEIAATHKKELDRQAEEQTTREEDHRRHEANMQDMVIVPWNALGEECRQFVDTYNAAFDSQQLYIETHLDIIMVRSTQRANLSLRISLDRSTGTVGGVLNNEPLRLKLHMTRKGGMELDWAFEEDDPAEPEAIATALCSRLGNLAVGIPTS